MFDRFAEFADAFDLGEKDLILTEIPMYEGYIKELGLGCRVILKDKYSLGEPDEDTVNAILKDMADWAEQVSERAEKMIEQEELERRKTIYKY